MIISLDCICGVRAHKKWAKSNRPTLTTIQMENRWLSLRI